MKWGAIEGVKGATVSGKEMTYWKMVDDKRVDFRLFRE